MVGAEGPRGDSMGQIRSYDLGNAGSPSTGEGGMQNYHIMKPIGKGKFAVVYRAKRVSDQAAVAMKRISIETLDEKSTTKCLKEVRLLQSLDHPNIIQYLDSFIDNSDLVIVFEWAAAGDLKRQVRKAQERQMLFEERVIWKYFSQICQAIGYMHECRIMHRDLKPANIFLTLEGQVKVGDLGLGRSMSEHTLEAHSKVGTPLYMSPEVLRGDGYDWKSDVWSLGCMLYELAMLRSPFKSEGLNLYSLFQKISKGDYAPLPEHYSMDLIELAYSMINTDPADRPDIRQVCETASLMRERTANAPPQKVDAAVVPAPTPPPPEPNLHDAPTPKASGARARTPSLGGQGHTFEGYGGKDAPDRERDELQPQAQMQLQQPPRNGKERERRRSNLRIEAPTDPVHPYPERPGSEGPSYGRPSQQRYSNEIAAVAQAAPGRAGGSETGVTSETLAMMQSVYDSLQVLQYPDADRMTQLHFVLEGGGESLSRRTQFMDFLAIVEWGVGWLGPRGGFKLAGGDETPPNVLALEALRALQGVGLREKDAAIVTPMSLTSGFGEGVLVLLSWLTNSMLQREQHQPLTYHDEVEVGEDHGADVSTDGDNDIGEDSMGDSEASADGGFGQELDGIGVRDPKLESGLLAESMLVATVDPVAWRKELERVAPRLRASAAPSMSTWRGRLTTMQLKSRAYGELGFAQDSGVQVSKDTCDALEKLQRVVEGELSKVGKAEASIEGIPRVSAMVREMQELQTQIAGLEEKKQAALEAVRLQTEEMAALEDEMENVQTQLQCQSEAMSGSLGITKAKGDIKKIRFVSKPACDLMRLFPPPPHPCSAR
ncbi:unnamed protein product [Chrysoparadoxa australica]